MARSPPEIFCQYTRPCGVSSTPRPLFCSNWRPRKASSPAICLLTALAVMHSAPEARVMLWCRATASKASSSWMVGQSRFIYGFDEGSVKNAFQLLKCLHPGFTHLWVFAP